MIPFSDTELKPVVERVLATVEPMLALDGGSIRLLDVRDGVAYVQLLGACTGCPSSGDTLKFGVEKKLKDHIHPELTVINVLPGQESKLLG